MHRNDPICEQNSSLLASRERWNAGQHKAIPLRCTRTLCKCAFGKPGERSRDFDPCNFIHFSTYSPNQRSDLPMSDQRPHCGETNTQVQVGSQPTYKARSCPAPPVHPQDFRVSQNSFEAALRPQVNVHRNCREVPSIPPWISWGYGKMSHFVKIQYREASVLKPRTTYQQSSVPVAGGYHSPAVPGLHAAGA